jgi:transposase
VRLAGRIATTPQALRLFGESLQPTDLVMVDATRNGKPPLSDVFGVRGRAWLARLELPADERLTVDACLRHIDMLGEEIGLVEQAIAADALASPETRRLLTIPGVNAVTACLAAAPTSRPLRWRASSR